MCFTYFEKKVKAFKQDLLKICLHIKEEYFQEKSTFFDKEICTSPKQHGNNLCDFKIQNSLSVCYLIYLSSFISLCLLLHFRFGVYFFFFTDD